MNIEHHRLKYDVENVVTRIITVCMPVFLAHRLSQAYVPKTLKVN